MENDCIGAIIHKRRKQLKLTLENVGDACGVNRSTVMRWENGRAKDIKRSHIEILSRYLFIPIPVLIGIDDESTMEAVEVSIMRDEIIKQLKNISDLSKLENIKKYIEVFVL